MKNISLTLLFAVSVTATANAQFALEAGLNMANLTVKSAGTAVKTSFKPGFAMGALLDIAIADNFYFEPGVFYEMNGAKTTAQPTGKYNISTIGLPLNIEYKSGEKCGSRFMVGIGPYVGDNISANYVVNAYNGMPATSETLKIGTAKATANSLGDDLKAWDIGARVNAGFQFKFRLYARVHYQYGFAELNPNGDEKNTVKSSAIGVTVGYLFGKCESFSRLAGFPRGKHNHWRGLSKGKYSRKVRYMRR